MNTRRKVLSGALALAGTAAPFAARAAKAQGADLADGMAYPQSAAEAASKVSRPPPSILP